MAIILNIDTAGNTASVCVAKDAVAVAVAENHQLQDHAAWLHGAIENLLHQENLQFHDIEAVAVSNGPGSYTGLRVGLAAAKGYCYALNIPLITLPTLRVMAEVHKDESVDFICPMIDARRMEVYMAVYDQEYRLLQEPEAVILQENSLSKWTVKGRIVVGGSGADKASSILRAENVLFSNIKASAINMSGLAESAFTRKDWANLAYTEPFYLKEFFHTGR
ncbi:MAG: tRNA (adenosine(37)-N6)-threonylcarbamoyltransferase complex dimerization subunit type 1 TsaB [Chitinophagaceae bacterium]|jgi:tRNA threonylcarbamoyladenosine biosynthesis protein TsaB|nr:tRNA (adenosine(37)-N6)-threonylcarbamoyltransferase complex dimerization subunit type 1 TsaB [Chitinophagaceae bacterium]